MLEGTKTTQRNIRFHTFTSQIILCLHYLIITLLYDSVKLNQTFCLLLVKSLFNQNGAIVYIQKMESYFEGNRSLAFEE